jgi:hypothetical protein
MPPELSAKNRKVAEENIPQIEISLSFPSMKKDT